MAMGRSRVIWVAAGAFAALTTGCGGASTQGGQSNPATSAAASEQASPAPGLPSTQLTVSGGLTGTFHIQPSESICQTFTGGLFSASFDGSVQGKMAALAVEAPPGTHNLTAGDAVSLDTSADSWNNDTAGTLTIVVAGISVTGTVNATIAGAPNGTAARSVPALQIAGSWSCKT
jgi:hypothetical protein